MTKSEVRKVPASGWVEGGGEGGMVYVVRPHLCWMNETGCAEEQLVWLSNVLGVRGRMGGRSWVEKCDPSVVESQSQLAVSFLQCEQN